MHDLTKVASEYLEMYISCSQGGDSVPSPSPGDFWQHLKIFSLTQLGVLLVSFG